MSCCDSKSIYHIAQTFRTTFRCNRLLNVMCHPLSNMQVTMQIPESPAFLTLEALQRRIDDHICRKRSSIREAVLLPDHPKRKLRLYIFNSHAHQKHSHHSQPHHPSTDRTHPHPPAGVKGAGSGSEPASWTLLISGRVLDPDPPSVPGPLSEVTTLPSFNPELNGNANGLPSYGGAGPSGGPSGGSVASPKPSNPAPAIAPKFPTTFYFRRIEIQLDPTQYPGDAGHIVWEKVYLYRFNVVASYE